MNWILSWPEKDGYYWFYGWTHKCLINKSPKLHFVQVRYDANKNLIYITEGRFIYKEEGAYGKWLIVNLPKLPNKI